MFSRSRCKNTTRGIAGCFIRVCFAQKARKLRCSRDWIRHGVSPIRTRLEVGEGDAANGWGQGVGEREKRDQAVSQREGRGGAAAWLMRSARWAGKEWAGEGKGKGKGVLGCGVSGWSPFLLFFFYSFLFHFILFSVFFS